MRTMFRGLMAMGLVALLASPALAQGGRGGFGRMGGISMLIGNESVQKELKLDDKQIEKVKEIAAKNREKMTAAQEETKDLDQEERRTKMTALGKEMNESTLKALAEFVKPEQIARLHQISHQVRGANAFTDPEVAKKLSLTDAQQSEIKSIVDDSNTARREIFQSLNDDREAGMKKLAELNKETLAKVTAKLNDEQQKTWKEMIGSPFEIVFPPRPNN